MKKDLRKMLKDGMFIQDYTGSSYLIEDMGTKYLCDIDLFISDIYSDFDEDLKDTRLGDELLDVKCIFDDEGCLIWERNKEKKEL